MNLLMISPLILAVLYLAIIDRAESQSAGRMTCSQGPQGNPGTPGNHGVPGNNGMPGSPGRDGRDAKGEAGPKGDRGEAGPKGDHGEFGSKGDRGEPGPQSSCPTGVNWKQCVWKRDDNKDNGLIQECNFNKKYIETSLRVFFDGTLRIAGCSTCCKRWYFTFNGAECSGPMTIEGIVYTEATNNIHRHRHIEGYCNNIAVKGKVRVGFWVGDCSSPVGKNVDAYTGWNAVSRIVIQEIPHQQPPI